MNEVGNKILNKELNIIGYIIEILPINKYRPKPLYRIKYDNGNVGLLEEKDFIQLQINS